MPRTQRVRSENLFRYILASLGVFACSGGCLMGDPAPRMIAMVDSMPPEKRPPDWARTKALMSRAVPTVGSIAPDFTLPALDAASEPVRLSTYAPGRPKVLIFASFT